MSRVSIYNAADRWQYLALEIRGIISFALSWFGDDFHIIDFDQGKLF